MNKQPCTLYLARVFALALTTVSAGVFAATAEQDVTDARQETQIWTTYALSPYLRANDLKVSVDNGKATLTGIVAEDVNKDLAKEIALGVKGITAVDNQIVVNADYQPVKQGSERSFGDAIDDASITATIKSKLIWGKSTDGMSTHVDTKYGRVTLRGTAHSAAERDLAGRIAMNTHGVAAVDNQIKVSASKPTLAESGKSMSDEASADISDSWITTKVKSTLLYSSNVPGTAIDVTTNKGVVSLSGKVNNGAEHDLAIELAQNVRGVKSVQAKELVF
ncbi:MULTISPECIES: BON domain-containing protein [unclassified Pseudomonas]|uniref:BON domain-containing protein n=1 Tax=unclassified Pseudomonas TaxID=196821 RepID=UPI001BCD4C15|nr:BON domain-containing protein [Pseudomonas sp. Pc102]BBP83769.1 transporter [Pseudomonas sp. Pc102]